MKPKISTVSISQSTYPENLKNIAIPPEQIFLWGKLSKKDTDAIAIVGTRTPTKYGLKIADEFANQLARKFTIISGLARGIDTVVHKAALKAGGRTIAVLGSGLDYIYPSENSALAAKISQSGAVVSEFPLGTKPLGRHFLVRNRIVSGLSKAVLIVEGAQISGTISTATWAAQQGRDVFAIPGPANSRMSEAPNFLIKNGAYVAVKPQDIIDILL